MAKDAGSIRAGKAHVEVSSDNSKLVAGLKSAASMLKSFGSSIASIGKMGLTAGAGLAGLGAAVAGAGATGIIAATKHFADAGSELADMSARTGASVESLSALKYAAEQTGADLGSLEAGLRKMQKTVVEAAGGSKEAKEALADIGLSASHLANMAPEDQLGEIADGLAAIRDPARLTAAAMGVFGKSGTSLIPMLSGGRDALEEFRRKAEELGIVMTAKDAAAADAMGDAFDDLGSAIGGLVNMIGATFAPAIQSVVETMTLAVKGASDWVVANGSLMDSVTEVFGAIKNSIAGGDIQNAMNIAMLGVQVAFGTALEAIDNLWEEHKEKWKKSIIEFLNKDLRPEWLIKADKAINDLLPEALRIGAPSVPTTAATGAVTSSSALDDIRRQLAEAIAKGNEGATESGPRRTPIQATEDLEIDPDKMKKAKKQAQQSASEFSSSSVGTFSAAGVAGLAGKTQTQKMAESMKETAKATKETATNTAKIAQQKPGLAFT